MWKVTKYTVPTQQDRSWKHFWGVCYHQISVLSPKEGCKSDKPTKFNSEDITQQFFWKC